MLITIQYDLLTDDFLSDITKPESSQRPTLPTCSFVENISKVANSDVMI